LDRTGQIQALQGECQQLATATGFKTSSVLVLGMTKNRKADDTLESNKTEE